MRGSKEENEYVKILEERIFQRLDFSNEICDGRLSDLMDEVIKEYGDEEYLSLKEKQRLKQKLYQGMRGYDVLTPLLERDDVTEIMVNGYENIFIEVEGRLERYPEHFSSEQKLQDVIQQIVSGANRRVNEASPIVDTRLSDGSRVNVVLSPVSLDGSAVTIRKFPKETYTMEKLIALGSLPEDVAKLLEIFVLSGYNIIISGGTGSGKTTFLNALSNYIPKKERVITMEDSAELKLIGIENLVRMEVRTANLEGNNAVEMKDLLKTALRMRPSRIVIGEVRGEEALYLLQAMNTGHDGSISTAHANSAKDMLSRLETMVMMGVELPLMAIRGQIASAVDIIVHLGRLRDKSRRVLEIIEVLDLKDKEIRTRCLAEFEEEGEKEGRVIGSLKTKNGLIRTDKLKLAGYYPKYEELMKKLLGG